VSVPQLNSVGHVGDVVEVRIGEFAE
jgi:hypothetical protein